MPDPVTVREIIIADDDYDDQMLLQEVIGDFNGDIKIITVSDGLQLMELLRKEKLPDLLLLDLNMPYKSGIDCLAEIRERKETQTLPVVIFSTSKAARDMEQCYLNGANLFLSKPCTFDGLRKMTQAILTINWAQFKMPDKKLFIRIANEGSFDMLYEKV